MTEHALLYAIAIATGISALAWVVVVIGGMKMAREMSRIERELRGDINSVMEETLPLIREVRGTVSDVRNLTRSGKEIAEGVVSTLVSRRLSGRWMPTKKMGKVGANLARQGVHALRGWLHTRHEAKETKKASESATPAFEEIAPERPE